MRRLLIWKDAGQDRQLELTLERVGIGREPDNALQVDDTFMSRHHAEFRRQDGEYWVHDLDSRNGTFLNDQRIHDAQLKPGDRVRVGGLELVYELRPDLVAPPPAPAPDPRAAEYESLKRELGETREAIQHLTEQNAALTEKAANRQRELATELAVVQQGREDAVRDAERFKRELGELAHRQSTLIAEVAAARQEAEGLRERMKLPDAPELAAAQARVKALEEELATVQKELADARDAERMETGRLTAQVRELSAQNAKLIAMRSSNVGLPEPKNEPLPLPVAERRLGQHPFIAGVLGLLLWAGILWVVVWVIMR